MNIEEVLKLAPVVPVIVIDDVEIAVPLARALCAGGLRALEITLRTPAALGAIERIARDVPQAVVGAGTVLHPRDARAAETAGARFLVSPGATESLLAAPIGLPWLPGVATATEAMRVRENGYRFAKLFPAEAVGGQALLKGLYGPLPDMRFCPTGGIGPGNAPEYLRLPNVVCVGGSWVAPAAAVASRDWAAIERLARQAFGLSGATAV
jgi:2-dehydro-3-deoxyphosphogluconate aldolase/(4S)-4-hydroxy-2-oxoglutarate aldolase